MCLDLSLVAILLTAMSGVPGLALGRRSGRGPGHREPAARRRRTARRARRHWSALMEGVIETSISEGALPELTLHLRLDPLAAFFLVPVYVLGAAGTLYGARYWRQAEHPENGRKLRLCFGVLIASLAGVVLAADGVAFLFAWEIIVARGVPARDHRGRSETRCSRPAGSTWWRRTRARSPCSRCSVSCGRPPARLELNPLPAGASRPGVTGVLFLLALLGFGLKAGIVPLHFWLPAAHANAPSHVSALLSGVVLKMGIYGLLRILTLLPTPPTAVGMALLAVGAGSAVYGVLFALGQHDFKRLLAYHSVENIGIIVMGLGLALIGVSARQPAWAALGLAGCLLHVWNHALFKALLFLAAGSVIHGTGTREIDRLGGLARPMAHTASLFAIGAAAICGLPPLNGFVSELLIYIGLLRINGDGIEGIWSVAPLTIPLLAMAGALAIACFVKAFGTVFLGPSRSERAARAHEAPSGMLLPMLLLALGCIGIGALPILVMPALDIVIRTWVRLDSPPSPLVELVPWYALMGINAVLVLGVLGFALLIRSRSRLGTSGADGHLGRRLCAAQRDDGLHGLLVRTDPRGPVRLAAATAHRGRRPERAVPGGPELPYSRSRAGDGGLSGSSLDGIPANADSPARGPAWPGPAIPDVRLADGWRLARIALPARRDPVAVPRMVIPTPISIELAAAVCILLSGAPGCLFRRTQAGGQGIATALNLIGSAVGFVGLAVHALREATPILVLGPLPVGRLAFALDGLSALFLIPILLISALGSLYGASYWRDLDHRDGGRRLRLGWGIMTAAMMAVVLARDAIAFLVAWGLMAIAAFFLIGSEEERPEVRQVSWIYLVAALFGQRWQQPSVLTWDCAYASPTPRMQYVDASFSEMLVELFDWAVRSRRSPPELSGLLPPNSRFRSEAPDPVLDRVVLPLLGAADRGFSKLRVLQRGPVHTYLLYVVLAVVSVLLVAR